MGNPVTFKIDAREFTDTLKKYKDYSKRDVATIVNTKAFYIARGATRLTPGADPNSIKSQLGRLIRKNKKVIAITYAKVKRFTRWGLEYEAPFAALIINARLGRKSKKGLYGQSMRDAITRMISARNSSVKFLASGWIQAIKTLAPLAAKIGGGQKQDPKAREIGPTAKGSASPARNSAWSATALITNSANAKRDHKDALMRYAKPALEQAFADEEQSMQAYIENKQSEAATKAGIKHSI